MSDEQTPAEAVKEIHSEIDFLRQLVYLQSAQLEALAAHLSSVSAEMHGTKFEVERAGLGKIIQTVYDDMLEEMRQQNPSLAESVDMRNSLKGEDRYRAYFPTDPNAKRDEE